VPDFSFVLEMGDHLGLAGQGPHEPPPIRCRVLLGWFHVDLRLVHKGCRLVNGGHQQLHEPVHHIFILILVADLESVVEEYVSC